MTYFSLTSRAVHEALPGHDDPVDGDAEGGEGGAEAATLVEGEGGRHPRASGYVPAHQLTVTHVPARARCTHDAHTCFFPASLHQY